MGLQGSCVQEVSPESCSLPVLAMETPLASPPSDMSMLLLVSGLAAGLLREVESVGPRCLHPSTDRRVCH